MQSIRRRLQRALDGAADVLRTAVDAAVVDAGLGIDVPAELGGNDHLTSEGAERFADELLVAEGAIGLGGVYERDATLDRRAEQRDHLPAIDWVAVAHGAERESRDLEALADRADVVVSWPWFFS